MSICLTEACVGCPEWIVLPGILGWILIYLFVGWLLYRLAKEIFENLDEILAGLILMLWPLAIAVGVIIGIGYGIFVILSAIASIIYWVFWYLAKLFRLPITAVEIDDLVKSERKVERKISESESKVLGAVSDHVEVYHPPKAVRKPKEKAKKVTKKVSKKKAKK